MRRSLGNAATPDMAVHSVLMYSWSCRSELVALRVCGAISGLANCCWRGGLTGGGLIA